MKAKKVYLIGAGPGDPGLITVKGLNILRQADVIIYDYLVDRAILDQAKDCAQLICREKLSHRLNDFIAKKVAENKKVIRLKNGDPSVFGRYTQELAALAKKRIEFEVVPGVTAATAASSLSGIPLTDRRVSSTCVFVTGHEARKKESLINWQALGQSGTIVLYMAAGNLKNIARKILEAGKDKNIPVGIIKNISLPTQKTITLTLEDIASKSAKRKIKPPAIIIIGEVVKLQKGLNWLRRSRRILFTGLSKERYFNRGTYFHLPLIKIEPMEDYRKFDSYLSDIKGFDWIVFASRYGVEYFFKRLRQTGQDARTLKDIKIAAIGNSTAQRLLDFGIIADLIPKEESSLGLINEFKKVDLRDKKIFLPRSDISDKGLSCAFQKLGAKATTSFAYRNVEPCDLPDLDLSFFDEIMFTSPSTVRNFKKRYKSIPKNVKIKCIGNVTLKEAKRCRLSG